MPRPKPSAPVDGRTPASQFRLKPDTLADLDAIAAWLAETTAMDASRSDAIRYAARQAAERIRVKR